MFDDLTQDLRFAWRGLRRSPLFTGAALLSLAAGIGVNTLIFTFLYGYFLGPLPFPDSGRLTSVLSAAPELGIPRWHVTWNEYQTMRAANRSFTDLSAYELTDVTLTGGEEPYRDFAVRLSDNYFKVLGLTPLAGRDLLPSDSTPTDQPAVLLGHGIWQQVFGGDPAVLGRTIHLSGEAHTVVGIMPPAAELAGLGKMFIPFRTDRMDEIVTGRLRMLGRLASGVTLEGARNDLNALFARLAETNPDESRGKVAVVESLRTDLMNENGSTVLILYAVVSLVLLLACANVSSLLLARGSLRGRELAVRASLGAGRGRLMRQLLTESLLLALLGGALGFLLGLWGRDLVVASMYEGFERTFSFAADPRMTLMIAGITVLCGVVLGLLPARLAVRTDTAPMLRRGASGQTVSRERTRFQSLLSGLEVAATVMVVIAAGMMLKSYRYIATMDRGFDPADVVHMEVRLEGPAWENPARVVGFFQEVIAEVGRHPAVAEVAAGNPLPYIGWYRPYQVEGDESAPGSESRQAVDAIITPGFFRTLGMTLLAGRDFGAEDARPGALPVVVVSEDFARCNWPGRDPLGLRLRPVPSRGDPPPWLTVVGVVKDTRAGTFLPETGWVFLPHAQVPTSELILVMRTRGGEYAAVMEHVKGVVWAREPGLAMNWNGILSETVRDRYREPSLFAAGFTGLSLIALILAVVGIYGVVAGAVARRSREFGIRLSLGARPGELITLVLRQSTRTALFGLLLGTLAAFASMRLAAGLLYGVRPYDPLVYLAGGLVTALATLAAALVPALRIVRVDPVAAIRVE